MRIQTILLLQATYYFTTAIWPLIHIKSFEFITGPKKENWLVYTVALLLSSSALVFFYAGQFELEISRSILLLSMLNCFSLILIDIIFVIRKTIRKIYLLDAVLQLIIIILIVTYGNSTG